MVSVINPSSDLYHHSPLAPLASFDSPGSGIESSSTQSEKNCPFKDFILNDKWRRIFDQYDPEGFGEIPWNDFLMLLNSSDFVKSISQEKRDILLERARQSNTSAITFQDFVNIVGSISFSHSLALSLSLFFSLPRSVFSPPYIFLLPPSSTGRW